MKQSPNLFRINYSKAWNLYTLKYYSSNFIKRKAFFIGRHQQRKAVSEVIATLLLLAITVVGAVMVSIFFQGSQISSIAGGFSPSSVQSPVASIILIGYDTRDSTGLYGTALNNNFNNKLCTTSCNTNTLPVSGGTEFIVLKIRNDGTNPVTLGTILVNNVDHRWDTSTGGATLSTTSFPEGGKYSIVRTSDNLQKSNTILQSNEEVLLVIKLDKSLVIKINGVDSDILLNYPLTITFLTGSPNPPSFVVLSGDAR